MLMHALNQRARDFYEYYGFKASPINPMTLMHRIDPAYRAEKSLRTILISTAQTKRRQFQCLGFFFLPKTLAGLIK